MRIGHYNSNSKVHLASKFSEVFCFNYQLQLYQTFEEHKMYNVVVSNYINLSFNSNSTNYKHLQNFSFHRVSEVSSSFLFRYICLKLPHCKFPSTFLFSIANLMLSFPSSYFHIINNFLLSWYRISFYLSKISNWFNTQSWSTILSRTKLQY